MDTADGDVSEFPSPQSGSRCQQQRQQQRALQLHSMHRRSVRLQLPLMLAAVFTAAVLPFPAAAWKDVVLQLGSGVYNPSLVVYQGSGWVVARSTQLKWDTTGLKWIMNRAYLCNINLTDWTTISCHDFDPWRGQYGAQCRWGSNEWKVPWEAWGVDDTKLFVWPGRGLWAMTGRRPQHSGGSHYCPQVIWRQWLVQLAQEGQTPNPQHFEFTPTDTIPGVTWTSSHSIGGSTGPADSTTSSSTTYSSSKTLLGTLSSKTLTEPQRHLQATRQPDGNTANLSDSSSSNASSAETSDQHVGLYPAEDGHQQDDDDEYDDDGYYAEGEEAATGDAADSESAAAAVRQALAWRKHRRRPPQAALAPGANTASGFDDYGAVAQQQMTPHQRQRRRGMLRRRRRRRRRRIGAGVGAGVAGDRMLGQPSLGAAAGAAGTAQLPLLPSRPAVAVAAAAVTTTSSSSSGWGVLHGAQPLPLVISDAAAVYGTRYAISEKNWMPFVHDGQLMVTYSLTPKHRVYQLKPDGAAEPKYESDPSAVFQPLGVEAAAKLHGGPPLVKVSVGAAAGQPYYLGVAHYWLPTEQGKSQDGRVYRHYFIKVQAEPPFRVLQLSDEIPLRYNAHYKQVAFVSGLDLAMLPAGAAADGSPVAAVAHEAATTATTQLTTAPPQQHQEQQARPARRALLSKAASAASAAAADGRGGLAVMAGSKAHHPQAGSVGFQQRFRRAMLMNPQQQQQQQQMASTPQTGISVTTSSSSSSVKSPSQSTGDLTADADADEFSWMTPHRPFDVNTFSWTAKPKPAAAPAVQKAAAPQTAMSASSTTSSSSSSSSSVKSPSQSTGDQTADADADEFSWMTPQQPFDVNTFSWTAKPNAVLASAAMRPALSNSIPATNGQASSGPVIKTPVAPASGSTGAAPHTREGDPGAAEDSWQASQTPTYADTKKEGAATAMPVEALLPASRGSIVGDQQAASPATNTSQQLAPHVLLSYGSGDWESHVAVITLDEVEQLFQKAAWIGQNGPTQV